MEELKIVPNQVFIVENANPLFVIPENYYIKETQSLIIAPEDLVTNLAYQVPSTLELDSSEIGAGYSLIVEPILIEKSITNPELRLQGYEAIKEKYSLAAFPSDATFITMFNLNLRIQKLAQVKASKKIKGKPAKANPDNTEYLKIPGSSPLQGGSTLSLPTDPTAVDNGWYKAAEGLNKAVDFLTHSPFGEALGSFSPELQGVLVDGLNSIASNFKDISRLVDPSKVSMQDLMSGMYSPDSLGPYSDPNTIVEGFAPATTNQVWTKILSNSTDGLRVELAKTPAGMPDLGAVPVVVENKKTDTHYRAGSVFGSNLGQDTRTFGNDSKNWYSFFEPAKWSDGNPASSSASTNVKVSKSFQLFTFPDFQSDLAVQTAISLINPEKDKDKNKSHLHRAPELDSEAKLSVKGLEPYKKTEDSNLFNNLFRTVVDENLKRLQKDSVKTLKKSKEGSSGEIVEDTDSKGTRKNIETEKVTINDKISYYRVKPLFVIEDTKTDFSLKRLRKNFDTPGKGNFQFEVKNPGGELVPDFYSNLHNIILDQQVQQQFYVAWFSYLNSKDSGEVEEVALELGSDFIKNYFLLINNFQFSPAKRGSMDFNYHYYKTSLTSGKPEGSNEFSFKLPMDIGLRTWEGFLKQGLRVGFNYLKEAGERRLVPANAGNFFTDENGNTREVNLHIVMPSFRLYDTLDLTGKPVYCNHLFLQNIKLSSGSDLAFSQSGNNVDEFSIKGIYKRLYLIQDQEIETKKQEVATSLASTTDETPTFATALV